MQLKALVFGATGKTGIPVVQLLCQRLECGLEQPDLVRRLHRPRHVDQKGEVHRFTLVKGDLLALPADPNDVVHAVVWRRARFEVDRRGIDDGGALHLSRRRLTWRFHDPGSGKLVLVGVEEERLEVEDAARRWAVDQEVCPTCGTELDPEAIVGTALVGQTLYVADTENHSLRKIDLVKKAVTTISGTGVGITTVESLSAANRCKMRFSAKMPEGSSPPRQFVG